MSQKSWWEAPKIWRIEENDVKYGFPDDVAVTLGNSQQMLLFEQNMHEIKPAKFLYSWDR